MLKVSASKAFKREAKQFHEALFSVAWAEVLYCLTHQMPLPEKYRDHALTGNFQDFRECHVKPDLLLIYRIEDDTLQLARLNTHAELFG